MDACSKTTLCSLDHDALGFILEYVTFISLQRLLSTGDQTLARRIYDAPTFTCLNVELEDEACYMRQYKYRGQLLARLKHVTSMNLPSMFKVTFCTQHLPPNLVTLNAPDAVLITDTVDAHDAPLLPLLRNVHVYNSDDLPDHVAGNNVTSFEVRHTQRLDLFESLIQWAHSLTRLDLGQRPFSMACLDRNGSVEMPQLHFPCLLQLSIWSTWIIRNSKTCFPVLERLDITPMGVYQDVDLSDLVHLRDVTINFPDLRSRPYVSISPATVTRKRLQRIKLAPNLTHLCVTIDPSGVNDTAGVTSIIVEWINTSVAKIPHLEQLSVSLTRDDYLKAGDTVWPTEHLQRIVFSDDEYVRSSDGAWTSLLADLSSVQLGVDGSSSLIDYFMRYNFVRIPPFATNDLPEAMAMLIVHAFATKPDVACHMVGKLTYRSLCMPFPSALPADTVEEWVVRLPLIYPIDCERDACKIVMAMSHLLPLLPAVASEEDRVQLLSRAKGFYSPRLLNYLTCILSALDSKCFSPPKGLVGTDAHDVTSHFTWLSLQSRICFVESPSVAKSAILLLDDWRFARMACKGKVHSLWFKKYPMCYIARKVYKALIAQGAKIELQGVVHTAASRGVPESIQFGSTSIILTNHAVRLWCTSDKFHGGNVQRAIQLALDMYEFCNTVFKF